MAVTQAHAERIVAVGEHVGFNDDRFTTGALDRETPTVDLRHDTIDDDSPTSCVVLYLVASHGSPFI
jgi:hypothetical protein